ncbi:TPA: hypothetical protein N2D99_002110 [Clostridium botulinum]|nr:hypothetical protein [Clostridium botulinum]
MNEYEVKKVINKYREGEVLRVSTNDKRITGILVNYNDNYIELNENGKIIKLFYLDIKDV